MDNKNSVDQLSQVLVAELLKAGKSVSTAESCTGGSVAKAITDNAGSSACYGYGIVCYSNGAKELLLGVSPVTLQEYGSVSEQAVIEMAEGCLNLSGADFAVSVSGVAGPDGGTEEKPVGTVWFCWATRHAGHSSTDAEVHRLAGDRELIRSQSVIIALQGVRDRLRASGPTR